MKTAEGLALALQAKDPHTNDFTLAILHLHENRFLEKLKRKWWETNIGCPQEQETSKACFALARQAQAKAQAQATGSDPSENEIRSNSSTSKLTPALQTI